MPVFRCFCVSYDDERRGGGGICRLGRADRGICAASPRGDRVFRIELRLREGEIRFFHERTGSLPNPGESDTQKSGNPSVNQPVKARKPAKK